MKQPALTARDGTKLTWAEAITASMEGLGHPATIQEIVNYMSSQVITEFPNTAKTPFNTVASRIYAHTGDSPVGTGNEHIFASFGRGIWGLSAWAQNSSSENGIR